MQGNTACMTQNARLEEPWSLPTAGWMWPQDCYLGSKRNRRKKTALLVSDYINLSDNGTSFLCLIKIWNSGCDLSFLYYSLPPGSRSQWWHCQNLWLRLLSGDVEPSWHFLIWSTWLSLFLLCCLQWWGLPAIAPYEHFVNKLNKKKDNFQCFYFPIYLWYIVDRNWQLLCETVCSDYQIPDRG